MQFQGNFSPSKVEQFTLERSVLREEGQYIFSSWSNHVTLVEVNSVEGY